MSMTLFWRRAAGCAGVVLLVSYLLNVIRVYAILVKRRKKVLSFQGTKAKREDAKLITEEEFEACLDGLRKKVRNGSVGLVSNASDIARRIQGESVGFVGGGCAALLQVAHPFVGKGVFDHSNVRQNPLARFQRTFFFVFRIFFGDIDTALEAARNVRKLHNRVQGTLGEASGQSKGGNPYSAHDHEAVKWVFATLLETQLFMYELLVQKLTKEEKDEFINLGRNPIIAFGVVPDCLPATSEEFDEYYFSTMHSNMLMVTKEGQEICDGLMKPRLWEKYLPFNTLKIVTGILLPEPISKQFGFDVGLGSYVYAAFFLAAVRTVYQALPRSIRYLTPFQEAECRETGRELPFQSKLAAKFASFFVTSVLGSP